MARLHKAAVVNGVSGRVLMDSFPLKKARRSTKKGKEAHIEMVLGEIYHSSWPVVSLSNFAKPVADYFPKNVNGTAKYCARCLAETGFVAAFFALRFIVCCPWHQQPLKPLCERCQDIRKFTPTPFASVVGYSCQDCGYWVPNRPVIFATCRSCVVNPLIFACRDFLANTERLERLAVLDVLHYAALPDRAQALAGGGTIAEVLPDETTKIWQKEFSMRDPHMAELGLPDEDYQRFVSFHQSRLLNAHRDCPCGGVLSLVDYGAPKRSVCVYNAALSLFRQKFELQRVFEKEPSISVPAYSALLEQNMAPSAVRVFFQCVFYQLVARLWFWSRSASRFFAHVDRDHFFAVLEASRNQIVLDRLLGKRLQGDYQCQFDLPADRVSMRRLMGPVEAEQVLVMRNFGNCAEFSTPAEPALFYGTLKATPLFYF